MTIGHGPAKLNTYAQRCSQEVPGGELNAQSFGLLVGNLITRPSSVAERLRRRLCNQKIAGSNPASGYLATPFRKEI